MGRAERASDAGGDAEPGASEAGGERALQRRWAESRWPTPFLYADGPDEPASRVRVITPGRWNHGPGPDFQGAQILDAEGRARRGDVELHLRPNAWLQHGHDGDAAYADILLHLVAPREGDAGLTVPVDPRVPQAVALPPAESAGAPPGAAPPPPCVDIVARAGPAAVEARLERIAERRFARKVRVLRALDPPSGPGTADDRRALIASARALGQPHNAARAERAAIEAIGRASDWSEVRLEIDPQGWRWGRGALGRPEGLAQVLDTLCRRWSAGGQRPWTAVIRLSALPTSEAVASLRIPRLLGAGRAVQLLADAVYPLTGCWQRWRELPAVRYRRSDELRERLGERLRWRHPHSQALLELEQSRCLQGACRICPLAALARDRSS